MNVSKRTHVRGLISGRWAVRWAEPQGTIPRGESQKKRHCPAAKDQGMKRNEEWSCFGEKEQLINSEEI